MAEPRPFQVDSKQRSVGAAGSRRRSAWPWIALSLALHGAIVLFALVGAARGGHTEILGTFEITVVGRPSAGDPDSRSAEGEAESEPAKVPRPPAPPNVAPNPAPVPQPWAMPQPSAVQPAPPLPAVPKEPTRPQTVEAPALTTPPRKAAPAESAPNERRPDQVEAPKRPERAESPDPTALPRKVDQAQPAPKEPRSESETKLTRPEAPTPPETVLPRKAEQADAAPVEPRLDQPRRVEPPPTPAKLASGSALSRAKAPRDPATPAKAAPRAGLKQAPPGQTASLGSPNGGERLGRSDSEDTGGVLNINLNPRFRAPPSPPVYPRQSVERDEEGVVLVRAFVDPTGAPQRVLLWKGSGFPLLDEAALKAVQGWRFEPMVREGRPTASWVQVPVRFRLN